MIWPEPASRDPGGMAAEFELEARIADEQDASSCYLQKFRLYATRSKFYMIGRNKRKTVWRVLKIDRSEPSELDICEDSTTYSESECKELLNCLDEGNKSTGGLKFVTCCYGIIGFIKFLGPYYMLLITERRQIGTICGHIVYAVSKSKMIALSNSSAQPNAVNYMNENRYKKLLCIVDLTKDFFFSYSYQIMRSLQKNVCDNQGSQITYETMFVWNEFLTRGIRHQVKNTLWTVALVYGFFKQEKLSLNGRDFQLTLIARRSRHYAGTRYLKRGVNEKGRVANDVETEQIAFEDIPGGIPTNISSIVQNRGSIPLFWSQETSKLNLKPDIVLHRRDNDYEATRLHFENLLKRYGRPIIILNLIKSEEKKPRESILRAEFSNAIEFINKDLMGESRLKYLHWDLHRHSRSKARTVLAWLGFVATNILNLTGFFHCQVTPALRLENGLRWPVVLTDDVADSLCYNHTNDTSNTTNSTDDFEMSGDMLQEDNIVVSDTSGQDTKEIRFSSSDVCLLKPLRHQNGVLRTNCIDCLDRTNVAQYAYGLAALGHQLYALNLTSIPRIDLDSPLADNLMTFYETMGDTLALQYGGSAAHKKIFSARRGQCKAATQSQEFLRTLQRYYSNAYMDAEKQAAINLFLGYFQPQEGKPAIWELDSDQHWNLGKRDHAFADEDVRTFAKRSQSDGNILHESNMSLSIHAVGQKEYSNSSLSGEKHQDHCVQVLNDSRKEMSAHRSDIHYYRCPPSPRRQLFADAEHSRFYESGDSNFLDLDWLSSSGNSCEEAYDRSTALCTPSEMLSTEKLLNGIVSEVTRHDYGNGTSLKGKLAKTEIAYEATQKAALVTEFSNRFVHWVFHGTTLYY